LLLLSVLLSLLSRSVEQANQKHDVAEGAQAPFVAVRDRYRSFSYLVLSVFALTAAGIFAKQGP